MVPTYFFIDRPWNKCMSQNENDLKDVFFKGTVQSKEQSKSVYFSDSIVLSKGTYLLSLIKSRYLLICWICLNNLILIFNHL